MRREHMERSSEVRKLNSTTIDPKHLEHASEQARTRNYQDFLIVDVDSHHYENEHYKEVFDYIESPVIRSEAHGQARGRRSGILNSQVGYQNTGGRIHRANLRGKEKAKPGKHSRHHADARLDGRDGRRLLLHVPDADAVPRPASAGRDRDRDVPTPTTPGSASASWRTSRASCRCCTCRSTIRKPPTRP